MSEKPTAIELKKAIMSHMFWRLHYPVVIDEYDFMDVFGIRRNGYMVEFEIKVSKQDLMREIKLSRCAQPLKYSKDWVKWEKHAHYLKRKIEGTPSIYDNIPDWDPHHQPYFVPNEFYFYVPDFLASTAVLETEGTPYGVVLTGKTANSYGREYSTDYEVVKKAVKMHSEKAPDALYRKLAHGLTIRNRLMKT